MAAYTQTYVDPSINAASGAGTVGDPYGDLQHALDTITKATNGDQINIKSGTAEILSAAISLTTYGTPTIIGPLIFKGYTTAADDGGQGAISGGGTVAIINQTSTNYIYFVDLRLYNTGSVSPAISIDDACGIINCKIDTGTGAVAVNMGNIIIFYNNHVTDVNGHFDVAGGNISRNFFEDGVTNQFSTKVIDVSSGTRKETTIEHNIISISGSCIGIEVTDGCSIRNNSIYASGAATGRGISCDATSGRHMYDCSNNLIEGFSGTGGIGIRGGGEGNYVYQGNAVYDCATEYSGSDLTDRDMWGDPATNETLSASPFTSASTGDFSRVDTGSVKEGSEPPLIGIN